MLHAEGSHAAELSAEFQVTTEKAIVALEAYRAWLQEHLQSVPENAAVGRANYEFFLSRVALIPYTPEQLLAISRQLLELRIALQGFFLLCRWNVAILLQPLSGARLVGLLVAALFAFVVVIVLLRAECEGRRGHNHAQR